MKKFVGLFLVAGVMAIGFSAAPANGFPEFKKAFEEKYVAGNPTLAAVEKTASCSVCHVKGKEKTVRNAYGEALGKFTGGKGKAALDKAGDDDAAKKKIKADLVEKLKEAFPKVEEEKSPSGKTFGELLKAGELPVPVPATPEK